MMHDAPTVFNPRLTGRARERTPTPPPTPIEQAVKACQFGELEELEDLIDGRSRETEEFTRAIHANDRDAENVPLLHWAAINNREHVVAYLLDRGADSLAVGGILEESALMWAARQGYIAIILRLMDAGAEPHQRNVYGQTAVHLAAQRNHTSSVLVLLAAGVPTDVK
ncbi:unnamed protein product, partial [Discosporangium mesarthrocarpum]